MTMENVTGARAIAVTTPLDDSVKSTHMQSKPFDKSQQLNNSWPAKPSEEAFHGLVGEVVGVIEPHSEVDPVAILIQLIVAFGNVIGRNAYFAVESTKHHLNLFAVLVGRTSKSRKGTSLDHIHTLID